MKVIIQMRDAIARQVKDGSQQVNLMGWFSRAALEFIGRGGLGHSFGSLEDEKSSEYCETVASIR